MGALHDEIVRSGFFQCGFGSIATVFCSFKRHYSIHCSFLNIFSFNTHLLKGVLVNSFFNNKTFLKKININVIFYHVNDLLYNMNYLFVRYKSLFKVDNSCSFVKWMYFVISYSCCVCELKMDFE